MLVKEPNPSPAARTTLRDYFGQFADFAAPYLEYDNGYRSWSRSYAQVGTAARAFAAKLQRQGVCKGDKIIFWSENRPEWVAAFWGCAITGVIVVPIDYRASADFLLRVQNKVGARVILIGDEVHLAPANTIPPIWPLAELDWNSNAQPQPVPLQPNDIAEIVFTSGATGEPKGVLITHRNVLANLSSPEKIIREYVKWFRPVFPLRFLNLVPLSHMFGQALTFFVVPLIPGVSAFMHGFSPHEMVRQIRSRRISVAVVVPKLLDVLREHVVKQFPEALESPPPGSHWTRRWWLYRRIHKYFGWKFWAFVSGAAPLEASLEEFWSRLGFVVIQGYGLTETAPIVAFNNPFAIGRETVGRPVEGTEIKVADDGEVLVRGESVTPGYFAGDYGTAPETSSAFQNGWLHTGDLGILDDTGRLRILGRKKEVIVTPEGLKVFPEDVERVLNATPGVRESAVVGKEHPYAVMVLAHAISPEEVIRIANEHLEDHQKIRGVSIWPGNRLPRTIGTEKIKRAEIQRWVDAGTPRPSLAPNGAPKTSLFDIVARYAPGRAISEGTSLDQLGLTSLDRVELMMDLEQHFNTSVDESALAGSQTLGELAQLAAPPALEEFPTWSRSWPAQFVRCCALFALWIPFTRLFARAQVKGREHLEQLRGPVIFASNHQSHMDTVCILAALPPRYRYHAGVAMWKEFFDPHFHPERYTKLRGLGNSLLYWLLAVFFNAFPLPQVEKCVGGSLRYIGDLISSGWSVIFFPEGERTEAGEIHPFQAGIGLIASRLRVPVVPVRLHGVEKVLHRGQHFPKPGRIEVAFGKALELSGTDYRVLAQKVEHDIRNLRTDQERRERAHA